MNSTTVIKYVEDIHKELAEVVRDLDKSAAIIEALELDGCKVSIVRRLTDKPFIMVRKDVKEMQPIAGDILRRLALAGFHLDCKPGQQPYSDYPEIGRREWSLTGRVKLALFVAREGDAGAKCFMKKVGTETIDKYEIVCSDA